jgi:hypothetical protein
MDSVEILMSISKAQWHGMRMTTTGGTAGPRPTVAAMLVAVFPTHARAAIAERAQRPSASPAGRVGAIFTSSHVPIVITGSSRFPLMGGLRRVVLVAVMLVLVAAARATRLAVDATLGTVLNNPLPCCAAPRPRLLGDGKPAELAEPAGRGGTAYRPGLPAGRQLRGAT